MDKIPKILHYCWFGNHTMPNIVSKCISTWSNKNPDYEIYEWNEKNFDVSQNKFTYEAYQNAKYAFVADYVRFYALNMYGGIYLDTDVEVLKSFNDLLQNDFFIGYERMDGILETHIMGCIRKHEITELMLNYYNQRNFVTNGKMDMRPNTHILTELIIETYGDNFDELKKITIYPFDYFCPLNLINGKLKVTKRSYVIHWHTLSWVSKKTRIIKFLRQKVIIPLFGEKFYTKFTRNRKR